MYVLHCIRQTEPQEVRVATVYAPARIGAPEAYAVESPPRWRFRWNSRWRRAMCSRSPSGRDGWWRWGASWPAWCRRPAGRCCPPRRSGL